LASLISKELDKLRKKNGFKPNYDLLTDDNMADAIRNKRMDDEIAFNVLHQMSSLLEISDELKSFTMISKAYTANGQNYPTLADLANKKSTIKSFQEKYAPNKKNKPYINGLNVYQIEAVTGETEEMFNNRMLNHSMGFINNVLRAAVTEPSNAYSKYLPFTEERYMKLVDILKSVNNRKLGSWLINKMYNDFMYYTMNKSAYFRFNMAYMESFPEK
jgi:hypothetical protein